MDSTEERKFVNLCIKKENQERLIFELQSKKHREKALSRLSHSPESMLNERFVKTTALNFKSFIEAFNIDTTYCYIITPDLCDGLSCSLTTALECFEKTQMLMILFNNDFAVIKEEVECGAPNIWFAKLTK